MPLSPSNAAIAGAMLALALTTSAHTASAQGDAMDARQDPVTRYFHITYAVPAEAPDQVMARCSWSPH